MTADVFMGLAFIWGAVLLGYIIAKPIDRKFKEKANKEADGYANGLKIRWTDAYLRELYAMRYETKIEPVENDILRMFKELNVKITEYTDTHVIIPWEYIIKWRHYTVTGDNLPDEYIIFNVANEDTCLVLYLSTACEVDPAYVAFKRYAKDKEIFARKEQNESTSVIILLILFSLIWLLACVGVGR